MVKNNDELISKIENDLKVLKLRKKIIQSKSVENENRKKRTRRLIQKGALLEKYFDIENLTVEQTEEFLKVFSNYVINNKPEKFKS